MALCFLHKCKVKENTYGWILDLAKGNKGHELERDFWRMKQHLQGASSGGKASWEEVLNKAGGSTLQNKLGEGGDYSA